MYVIADISISFMDLTDPTIVGAPMKFMTLVTAFLIAALFSNIVMADSLSELMKEWTEVYEKEFVPISYDPFDRDPEGAKLYGLIKAFESADEESAKRKEEIKRLRARLSLLEETEKYANSNAVDRQKQLSDLKQKQAAIRAKSMKKFTVAKKNIDAFKRKYATRIQEFRDATTKLFRQRGEGDLAALKRESVDSGFGFDSVKATYVHGELPSLTLSVKRESEDTMVRPAKEAWDEDVSLLMCSDYAIQVRAGEFVVNILAINREKWDQDKLKLAAKQLVDLKAIAMCKTK